MDHLAAFSAELESDRDRPEMLALQTGSLVNPALDVEAYMQRLDELADQVRQRMPAGAVGRARAEALIVALHRELKFFGNTENYYEPANSFLHRVLESHVGLPITLCLLYIAVGRRLGIRLQGMGFPGHFMLEFRAESSSWILDPFHGNVVSADDVSFYLSKIFQQPVRLSASLEKYRVNTNEIMLRVLNNLRAIYVSQRRLADALAVLNFMVIVQPEEPNLWRDRGMLHYGLQNLLAAENDLRRYFCLRDRFHLFVGESELAYIGAPLGGWLPEREQEPTEEERRIQILLRQIREAIRKSN